MTNTRWWVVSIVTFFCVAGMEAHGADGAEPFASSAHFISDAEPTELGLIVNPLDYAAERIGLDVRNVQLPREYEGNYRLACRFPIIDYVSNRPLYMKTWAESATEQLAVRHREDGIGAVRYALTLLRGTGEYETASRQAGQEAVAQLTEALSESNLTAEYQEALVALFRGYCAAWEVAGLARANLTTEDLEFFDTNPGYFLAPDGQKMPPLTGSVDSHFQFIERARRVGYEQIFYAAAILSDAVQVYVSTIGGFRIGDYVIDIGQAEEMLEIETAAGRVLISGFGADTHREDAEIIIDLGGDDTYANNAGGCRSTETRVACCIDHAGDDEYSSPGGRYVQGFGFLGAGLLIDLGGDDRDMAEHFAQAGGVMGVGVIWDKGGDDMYDASAFCQGAGMFGLGLLLDSAGEDRFDCATLGQGGATTLGLGILSDLEGDDRYQLAVSRTKDALGRTPGYGQGGALSFRHMPWRGELTAYGGVGMLIDSEGNDRYRSKGWCDQGGSYIMSLGVLVDMSGNDHYSSQTGQGSGIHVTNAILVDRGGHDIYEGVFRAGGSGGDRSPAFLLDYGGNDIYVSKTSSYGTGCKPFSFSLFVDYEGEDRYICPEPEGKITFNNWDSFGGVWPESEPYLWPYAICLDLGGEDEYRVRHRTNNSQRHSFGHGIHLDMMWDGGDVVGVVENPLEPYRPFPLPQAVRRSPYYEDIRALQSADTFTRFQAIGRITRAGPAAVPVLAETIRRSSHRQFNRDVMECLHHFLSQSEISETVIPSLVALLGAEDEEVRTVMADDFGVWKIAAAEEGLIAAARTDGAASVRRFALSSLMELESREALPLASDLALADPSEDVRRTAVRYLSRVRDDDVDPYPILAKVLQRDDRSSVRVAAAEGIGRLRDERGIRFLRRVAASGDVYLQRAAARSLAELYQIEGIELLIESLSFPSIDAFYNYDRNVPNWIAGYANFDLPEDERYDQERWREWYRQHRRRVDIRANVDMYRESLALTESLRGASSESQIQQYEEFLEKYPDNERIQRLLAQKLNEEAWNMVTAAEGTPEFDPETGLGYALRAVELKPHPNYYDTLAEAYVAAGRIDEAMTVCRQMLIRYPGEKMFLDRLERCERMQATK